jgi:oligopeptide transport system ATP-binding protein
MENNPPFGDLLPAVPLLLDVRDLSVSFKLHKGVVRAVRGVSFTVQKGESVAVVGESGCGKSVTSKALLGFIAPPSGAVGKESKIFYNGENILQYSKKQWRDYRGKEVSIIFQDAIASLNPTMKVGKQIAESLVTHMGLSAKAALTEAVKILETVGIPDAERRAHQYPHEFSGGMRQRVMIAIALACKPQLLIADEPTTALDVTIQAQIIDLISEMRKKLGMSLIIITHDLGVVADVADTVYIMYAGKIVEAGSTREVFYSPKHPYTTALLSAVPRLDVDKNAELTSIPGTPPDLFAPPEGCAFAARCKYRMGVCDRLPPERFTFSGSSGHRCDCWLYHENAPKTEVK